LSLAKGAFAAAEYASATIPAYPKLAPWVVPFDLGDGRLQLRGSVSAFTLPHPFFASIFRRIQKYLDGSRTADEVADTPSEEADRSAVIFLLKMLAAHGLLVAGSELRSSHLSEQQLNFFEQMDREAIHKAAALETKTVRIVAEDTTGALIASLFRQAGLSRLDLEGSGIAELSAQREYASGYTDGDPDLIVVMSKGLSDQVLVALNEQCLRTGARWLSANISGPQARLGPTFIPYHTACYICFKHRLNCNSANAAADRAFENAVAREHPKQGSLDAFTYMIAGHVVLEAVRLLTGISEPATIARYHSFNAMTPKNENHEVLRVPRCASCGSSKIPRRPWDVEPAGGEEQ